jgi:Rieske Fe-S protein
MKKRHKAKEGPPMKQNVKKGAVVVKKEGGVVVSEGSLFALLAVSARRCRDLGCAGALPHRKSTV